MASVLQLVFSWCRALAARGIMAAFGESCRDLTSLIRRL